MDFVAPRPYCFLRLIGTQGCHFSFLNKCIMIYVLVCAFLYELFSILGLLTSAVCYFLGF